MKISTALLSETGPRSVNEDAVSVWHAEDGSLIVAVADGLGGMGSGDTASNLAISTVKKALFSSALSQDTLRLAVLKAHSTILSAQTKDPERSKMATTMTVLAFGNFGVLGAHCGDTRAAVARASGIKRLTKDHSEGQRLFDAGKLTKEELSVYPRQHILESALGDHNAPTINTFEFDMLPGDRFVITSDGVHGIVLLREMREFLVKAKDPSEFVEIVKNCVVERRPKDNFSLAAVFIS